MKVLLKNFDILILQIFGNQANDTAMEFNHYFTNNELETALNGFARDFPDLARVQTIGRSHEGRPIQLLTITAERKTPPAEKPDGPYEPGAGKPAIWLDGNIHATELAGTTAALYIAYHLLHGYGENERIARLLRECVFYIVPRINPDGAAAALAENPSFVRSGVRPYPWEEREDGLHPQDIDGNGRLLQMRIPDPYGDWKPWEKDPHFLVKREPEDIGGTYYRLLPEGILDHYDGALIPLARPQAGLDFNRNFPFEWRPESDQAGAGPFPASEPEIAAVVQFIERHRNICAGLTFHTFSRALLRPFSTRADDSMPEEDLRVYKQLGAIGTRLTGYRNLSTYHGFLSGPKDITTGAFDDWLYDHLGAFVFTVELWDLPTEAGIADRHLIEWFIEHPVDDDARIFTWLQENYAEGYVPWYAFEHPQLGKVELGGWDGLYTWRNPPAQLLEAEVSRHLPFALTMAEMLPHLAVHTWQSKRLSEDTWLIDLVVENTGYFSTSASQQARKRNAVRPVIATLDLPPGVQLATGKPRVEIGYLEGRANKDSRVSIFGSSATDHRGRAQWIVKCPVGSVVSVTVKSDRAGILRLNQTLE
jgi:murein tripeptide amidase MpaA